VATSAGRTSAERHFPVEAAYDLAAPYYDDWKWQKFWRQAEHPLVYDPFRRFRHSFCTGVNTVDLGCGTGWYLEKLQGLCKERVGIDLSSGMLAVARHRIPHVTLIKTDALALPYKDERFDAVLCTRMLAHLSSIQSLVLEVRRVLRSGGLLVLSNVDAEHEYGHTRLPVGSTHILADTYKHSREFVHHHLEAAGFVADATNLIFVDGSSQVLTRRRLPSGLPTPVGWVSSWRKALSA